MSKRKKKLTRKQKVKRGIKPTGNSKYGLKLAKRKKLAKKLELPIDSPMSVIVLTMEEDQNS